ncbi:MAG: hypothetical protein R3F11_15065 [Verrucomicrobiales bacterium]
MIAFAALPAAAAESKRPEQMAFFENKVRPVLAERCYDCQPAGAEKLKAGFYADSRDGMLQQWRHRTGGRARRSGGEPAHRSGAPRQRRPPDAAEGEAARTIRSPRW